MKKIRGTLKEIKILTVVSVVIKPGCAFMLCALGLVPCSGPPKHPIDEEKVG